MINNNIFKGIYKDIESMPVFSDHDHHQPDEFFSKGLTLDQALARSYVQWTGYVSDGSLESRHNLLENVQYNTYFVWYQKGLQKVYGIDEPISMNNWDAISDKMQKIYLADSNFHWKALLKHGFERLILDAYWNPGDDIGHPEAFASTFRIDKFMYGYHPEVIAPDEFKVWERYNFTGKTLDDFVENMRTIIRNQHAAGKIAAFKCADAYNRHIKFDEDDKSLAEQSWMKHLDEITEEQKVVFGNYIFNRACELAEELDVPFQVHLGLAKISGSSPMNFEPIIAKYPNVKFVMFHSGYPWISEVAGLVHNYPNAYPSLTWTATISTTAAIRALHEFVDVSPSINTITWGSDCWVPEDSIGSLLAWRYIVARVITERIEAGLMSTRNAEPLARKLMFENAKNVYPKAFK